MHKHSSKISFCILTQAFSKDKTSSLFLFSPLKHSLHVSALRPDHMVSDKLLTKIIMDHKTSKLHFYFLQQLARKSESEGQRGVVKILHPSGVSPFPFGRPSLSSFVLELHHAEWDTPPIAHLPLWIILLLNPAQKLIQHCLPPIHSTQVDVGED